MTSIEQRIKILLDKGSQSQAVKGLTDLRKELERTGDKATKAFLRGETNADEYRRQINKIDAEVAQLNKTLDRLEKPRRIDVNTQRFDKVSRDVALAGDVQSNLGAISGLAGAAGAGGLGQGIGIAGELIVLTEELPRLKTAVQGLPAAANAAGKALGLGGAGGLVGALGAAAVATVALSFALKEFEKRTQEQISAVQASVNNVREFQNFLASGGTTEEARQRVEELEQARQAEIATTAQLEQALIGLKERSLPGAKAVQDLEKAIADSKLATAGFDQQIRFYTGAINDGATAAADATEAEKKLAESRSKSLLKTAQNAADLSRAQSQADELGIDALEDRIDAVADERAALEAQLAVLKSSGDTSEEVARQIEQLTGQIDLLGKQSAIFEAERPEAKARTAALEAEKQAEEDVAAAAREHKQALQEQERAAESSAKAQQGYADKLRDISQNLRDGRQDLRIDTGRKIDDLRRDAQREDLKAERDYQRDLQGIKEDARRGERDALRSRDFSALFESREEEADALKNRVEEFKREGQERLIEIRQQRDNILREERRSGQDLLRQSARQRRDALEQLNQFYNSENSIRNNAYRSSLNSAKQWAQAFSRTITSGFGAAGAGSSSNGSFEEQLRDAFAA